MEDTPTQPQETPAPAAAGPTAAELQARLEEVTKQSEGRLRDLQQERARRQELEAASRPTVSPTENQGATDNELSQVLKPVLEPLHKRIQAMEAQAADEKALSYLSTKTGKSVEAVLGDSALQDRLMGVARKWKLVGSSDDVVRRAYELMELEDLRSKEADRVRAASADATGSLPAGTGPITPSVSTKKYSAEEFNGMSPKEFGQLSKSGDFRKLPDGTFEYKSR